MKLGRATVPPGRSACPAFALKRRNIEFLISNIWPGHRSASPRIEADASGYVVRATAFARCDLGPAITRHEMVSPDCSSPIRDVAPTTTPNQRPRISSHRHDTDVDSGSLSRRNCHRSSRCTMPATASRWDRAPASRRAAINTSAGQALTATAWGKCGARRPPWLVNPRRMVSIGPQWISIDSWRSALNLGPTQTEQAEIRSVLLELFPGGTLTPTSKLQRACSPVFEVSSLKGSNTQDKN